MARSLLHRLNSLLTWKRACLWAGVICTLYVVAYAYVLINGKPPLNSSGTPIGGDYIAFQAAGRLMLTGEGAYIYDPSRISATQDALLRGAIPGFYDAFRNPPFVALIFAPMALLDLLPGFAIWTVVSLVCLAAAIRLMLEELPSLKRRWRGLLVLLFAFAPLYFGLIDGQNATVSLLLYVLIYRALARGQDGRAGMWAAVGLFKPQLFLVFPVVFLASGRRRSVITYGLTAAGLAGLSLALVGIDGMQAWLHSLVEPESGNLAANAWRMSSLTSFFDSLFSSQVALTTSAYLISAVVLLGLLVATWRLPCPSLPLAWTFTSLAAVLIDPHLVDYDLTVMVPAGVFSAVLVPRLRWWIVLLYVLLIQRVQVPLGGGTLQATVPLLVWCAFLTLKALYRQSGASRGYMTGQRGKPRLDLVAE